MDDCLRSLAPYPYTGGAGRCGARGGGGVQWWYEGLSWAGGDDERRKWVTTDEWRETERSEKWTEEGGKVETGRCLLGLLQVVRPQLRSSENTATV